MDTEGRELWYFDADGCVSREEPLEAKRCLPTRPHHGGASAPPSLRRPSPRADTPVSRRGRASDEARCANGAGSLGPAYGRPLRLSLGLLGVPRECHVCSGCSSSPPGDGASGRLVVCLQIQRRVLSGLRSGAHGSAGLPFRWGGAGRLYGIRSAVCLREQRK